MSSITIKSNIASLNAQRRFGQSTAKLQESFTRLSSGLRINRAKDDASGLSISTDLQVDARVFGQGIRNINDGISLLNIAEGATSELSNILLRQRELATQSANGSLSREQRLALDEEADALTEEYNRIVATTDFNGLQLIDSSLSELRVQGGYGENGSITFGIAEELSREVADGTFESSTLMASGTGPSQLEAADINNDGIVDLVAGNGEFNNVSITLGNGDGTFKVALTLDSGFGAGGLELKDVDNDGNKDILVATNNNFFTIFHGNGDGTFTARETYALDGATGRESTGDFNGDGIRDIGFASFGNTSLEIAFGNADGSFRKERRRILVFHRILSTLVILTTTALMISSLQVAMFRYF